MSQSLMTDTEGGTTELTTKTLSHSLWVKMLDEPGSFEGYASKFGEVDQGGDRVIKGAFAESLAAIKAEQRFVPMLWQHDQREPIGQWTEMIEDDIGLKVRGQIFLETGELAKRAHALLKAGGLGGLSIGYRFFADGYEHDSDEGVTNLKRIDLREISLVTMPMLLSARVTNVKNEAKALGERLGKGETLTKREWEAYLRDVGGLSKSEARRAVGANFLKADLRDSGGDDFGGRFLGALEKELKI